jgi:hypothetical protein
LKTLEQKKEFMNLLNNGIDTEILLEIKRVIFIGKFNELYQAYQNVKTNEDWYDYVKENSKMKNIPNEKIDQIFSYLKSNYKDFFIQVDFIKRPNFTVLKSNSYYELDFKFEKEIFETIKMWENSKKIISKPFS